jgi:hypothetical protein
MVLISRRSHKWREVGSHQGCIEWIEIEPECSMLPLHRRQWNVPRSTSKWMSSWLRCILAEQMMTSSAKAHCFGPGQAERFLDMEQRKLAAVRRMTSAQDAICAAWPGPKQ